MPAARLAPAGDPAPMPAKLAPNARRDRRPALPSRWLDVGAQARRLPRARVHRPRRREAALAPRPGARGRFPQARRRARHAGRGLDDPRRRDRRVRCGRQALVRRAAGARASEDRPRARPRRARHPRRLLRLRPALLRRHRPARRPLPRPAALPRAMPAAHTARAARARGGRWHRAQRGRARHRLRGRDRQARGQPLRGGQALRRVAQGEAGAGWRFRGRRLDARQGLARAAGRAAGGLLGARQAPLRLPRGLGLRRSQPRGRQGAARAARRRRLPVRRGARAQRRHDVGRAEAGGGSRLPGLDRRRPPARAGVPAATRRHRPEEGAAREGHGARGGTCRSARPRRGRGGAARAREGRGHARHRRTALQGDEPGPRVLAGERGIAPARGHQAGPDALLRAGLAVHAAAPRRPPAHHDPHARRHRRPAFLPEALDPGAPRFRRGDHGLLGPQGRGARVPARATISRRCSGSRNPARWSCTCGTRARGPDPIRR